ncbi:MAG TPA: peptide ABC transporter substrate-binding protein [Flexilinea sp.]|nr:peptide ABC transporter substrate-binding protein [Flexilinea sp.]
MKKIRWQLVIIFLTGLVVGILLLSDTSNGPIQMFESQPTMGGIYREGLVGNIQRMNPLLSFYNNADQDVCRLVYSGLIKFDNRGLPVSDLAAGWAISMDGTSYNFALNPNAKWHDGQPVTADDVVFTYEMLKKGNGYIPDDLIDFWNKIQIKAIDSQTVQFVLASAYAPFLDYLSVGILPKHIWGNMTFEQMVDSKVNIQPIGSGPFILDDLILNGSNITGIILKNNALYYEKKPYLEEIHINYYQDSILAFQAYQQGLVDGISYISEDVLESALTEPDLALYTSRLPIQTMVFMNLDNSNVDFFQDKNVRKAMLMGLNRSKIVNNILHGQAIIAHGPILYGNWAYYDNIPKVEYDSYKAKELLKSSGYILANEQDQVRSKDGKTLNFTLLYPDDDKHRQIAESIQQDWAAINILVNLEAVPYDELINVRLEERNYEAALIDLNLSDFPDPDPYPFWGLDIGPST